ncbi:hypothetical protein GGI35DRAFT_198084 [Trichoderma velutinum]
MSSTKNIATSGANQNNIGIEITFIKIISQGINWISNATKVAIFGKSLPDSNTNLWIGAYALAQQQESDLMESYMNHLDTLIDDPLVIVKDLLNPQYVESAVKKLLDIRKSIKIQIWVSSSNGQIQEQIDKLASFLIGSYPIINSAEPHVALAWPGVSLFLSLLAGNPIYSEAMLSGFNTISDIQTFWKSFGETYLAILDLQLQEELKSALTELYSSIATYQAKAICHLSQPRSSHISAYLDKSHNWSEMIDSIRSLEETCLKYLTETQQAETLGNSKLLLDEARRLRNTQEEMRDIMKEAQQDKEERKLLNKLVEMSKRYEEEKNRNPTRAPGTCEWFLMDDRFCKWRDGHSGVLWVSADPGCGKSVLSRTLIDEGHLTSGTTTITIESTSITTSRGKPIVCYFFFKEGGEGEMNIAQALCAVLHQLFTCASTAQFITHAFSSYKNYGSTLSQNTNELWRIIVQCAESSPVQIICIFDALDECREDGRKELINKLFELYSQNGGSMPSKLKFLITSRLYDKLRTSFDKFATSTPSVYFHFDADNKSGQINREINHFIDDKLNQITGDLPDTARDEISQHLKSMNSRTYLWLYLIFIIEEEKSAYSRSKDIKDFLSKLPVAVSDAYEKILSKINNKNHKRAEALLQIILAATRPLTLIEANYALTLTLSTEGYLSHKQLQEDLWSQEVFKTTSKNLCGLFIKVHDSKLSFIHHTAKEFLTHSERSGTWKGRLNVSNSHGVLSGACINYLKMLDTPFKQAGTFSLDYPFFLYAANSWPLHFRLQDDGSTEDQRKPARELCRGSTPQTRNWIRGFNSEIFGTGGWPDINIAAYFGLAAVAQDIIVHEHADINAKGGMLNRAPIHTAIRQGHLETMRVFMESHSAAEISVGDIIAAVKNSSKAAAMA